MPTPKRPQPSGGAGHLGECCAVAQSCALARHCCWEVGSPGSSLQQAREPAAHFPAAAALARLRGSSLPGSSLPGDGAAPARLACLLQRLLQALFASEGDLIRGLLLLRGLHRHRHAASTGREPKPALALSRIHCHGLMQLHLPAASVCCIYRARAKSSPVGPAVDTYV